MNQHRCTSLAKFASDVALPLVSVSEDGAISIHFQEGGRAELVGGPHRSSHSLFCLAVWGSLHLDGQPVRCTGIVPGVSLRVATGTIKLSDVDPGDLASDIWHAVRARFADWIANGPAGARKFGLSSGDGIEVEFGWDSETTVRPGVMHIDVEYAKAFEQDYIASRARRPLIELAPGQPEPPINVETSHRAGLIRRAMEKTILADSPLYERLPIPVRYRASGAIEAWKQLREDAGQSGECFSRRLTSEPLGDLMHNFPQYLRSWARGNLSCIGDEDDMGHAQRSVIVQAFSASHGALYEPTAALHRLLDDAYIADDVPVHMIRFPVDALCIVPDPSWSGRRSGIDAILLFRRPKEVDGQTAHALSIQTWGRVGVGDERRIRLQLLEFLIDGTEQTIKSLFDNTPPTSWESEDPIDERASGGRPYWETVLDYAIKMLLYLTVRDAHVVHDRAYTGASRDSWLLPAILLFIGLPILAGGASALLHRPDGGTVKVASARPHVRAPSRRHAVTEASRSTRIERTKEDRDASSAALLAAQRANEQALAAQAVQLTPAAPMPPCPAGNDRVGCVPDPQTRAKLHIH